MIQSGSRIDLLEPTILLAGLTRRLRNVLDTAEILLHCLLICKIIQKF